MSTFHRLVSRKDKAANGTIKKVMSTPTPSSPSESVPSASSYPSTSSSLAASKRHTRSSSLSSLSNAFPSVASKRSPRLQASQGTIESSTANSGDDWLLQPKQTSGFLHGSFPDEEPPPSNKDDEKKVKLISRRLASAGITKYKDTEISFVLREPYADGDPERAFSIMMMFKESEEGLIRPYRPDVKMLGAVNREGTTCYLDSLLFAVFARLGCFEAMLYVNFDDEKKRRLATLLRLWVNTLRLGKLITADITKHIQLSLAECGWEDAAQIRQQDASEAFNFITDTLDLPLLTLKMDIFHHGKEETGDDHKFVSERMLEVAIPEQPNDGSALTLEMCLENYFNNRIEVKRYLQRRQTIGSVRSQASFESSKGSASHIETVEVNDSMPSTPLSPLPLAMKSSRRPTNPRARASSIIQEYHISEKGGSVDAPEYESPPSGRRRAGSTRKEVMMPAWQFFSLIPWYTDAKPSNDAQVAAHFSSARPILGICLKRYSFLPNGQAVRKSTYVDIPLEIGLPHFIQDDNMAEDGPAFGNFKLSLQSAVCHRGTRVDSGHYIGLVRTMDSGDAEGNRWLRHDDLAKERVAEVNIEQFLREETPYLLFYQVVPIDGDPGNIMDGEVSTIHDHPPAYSEHWVKEADDDPDRKFSMGTSFNSSDSAVGISYDISGRKESTSSDRRHSTALTDASSNTAGANSVPRTSLEEDGFNPLTFRRSSKANGLAIPNGPASQPEGNRLSASMSRFAGLLTREKSDNTAPAPATSSGGPSLEVREEPGANDKGKLKKERSKSKLKEHQHLIKGRSKSEKPDRECILIASQSALSLIISNPPSAIPFPTKKMSTITRTWRNLRRIGLKEYAHQMMNMGDTKAGTYIATDRYGNKYYENQDEELPLRTRWVDYKQKEYDPSQIEPGWHAWMSYLVDKPPTEDPVLRAGQRSWELPEHRPNLTASRAAFKTYST
ncbi:MAG: hypothetical protein LQ338_000959 [Usnochroma carphineum]|nr:MAG: hypothetical protein LQ338_000959 [Usnochroma carphineum]